MSVMSNEVFQHLSSLASLIPETNLKENALNLLEQMNEVIEGVGDRPITWMPTMAKVIQGTTNVDSLQDGGAPITPGTLVFGNTTAANGKKVIPLNLWQSRSFWEKGDESSRKICNSPDAKLGWKYGECNKCDYSIGDVGSPPPCNKEYTFIALDADFSNIYMLRFHKMGYRGGMDWQKEITQSRTHPFKRIFELHGQSSEKRKTVKEIRAKLASGNCISAKEYSPEAMAFLEALYKRQVDDRSAFLAHFRETTQARLMSRHDGDSGRAIEHIGEDDTVAPSETDSESTDYKY